MKKICFILLFVCLIIISGCSEEKDMYKEIIERDNYVVIDVRTNEEFEESHVKGALNIPYDEIDDKVDLDKEKDILVYCKSGRRSAIAYETLTKLGYKVYDLGAFENVKLEKIN